MCHVPDTYPTTSMTGSMHNSRVQINFHSRPKTIHGRVVMMMMTMAAGGALTIATPIGNMKKMVMG